jgi:DNA helicase HerA-like ATPase
VDRQNLAYEILDEGLEKGKIVIIDLGDIRPPYKPGVVYKVLRHLLHNAKDAFIKNDHEEYVYSTLVILDEAHNYCPEVGKGHGYPYQEKCKTIVKSISADSAKYGLWIGIITQRYAWLSKDILANIRTFFIGPLGATESTNEMVKTILNGKDVSKLRKSQFYATGDAISCNGEIVSSFDPKEMSMYLTKRKEEE